MKRFSYGIEADIFCVHLGFEEDEKFITNILAGDIVLDMSTKGRVRGIEILNASQFFEDFDVDEKLLNNLTDVKFNTIRKVSGIFVSLILKSSDKEVPVKFAVALEESLIH